MEYLILILEFFLARGTKALIWYVLIPGLIGLSIYYCGDEGLYLKNASSFLTNIVTVLGILVGFTISTLALLLTVSNQNVDKAKTEVLEKKIFSKKLSLYDLVLIGLAYITLIQGFLLIGNFLYPIFVSTESRLGRILFAINISILIHVILILLRSILDFYFILTRK